MRIGNGDRAAFGALVRRHLDRAVAVGQRVTGSRGDAEEIAQEAFLRVWTKAPRWRAALTLCFYEGLSNREAADILALTPGAVESLLVRARRSLRQALAGVAAEFLEVSP